MTPLLTRRRTFAPWRELQSLEDRLRRLSEELEGSEAVTAWKPAVDLVESEEEYRLDAELPGMSADDIDVEVQEGDLVIHGEKESEEEGEGRDYRFTERSYGEFYRRFSLPTSVDAGAISARFENGVLTVRIPKKEQEAGRKIEITGD